MRRGRRPRTAPHRDEHDDALRRGLLERVLADALIVVRGVVRGRHLRRSAPRASPRLDRARCPTGAARGLHTTPANARPTAGVARGRPSLRGSRAPARAPASPRGDPCRAVDRAESRRADACAPPAVRDRGDGRTMGASGKYGKVQYHDGHGGSGRPVPEPALLDRRRRSVLIDDRFDGKVGVRSSFYPSFVR